MKLGSSNVPYKKVLDDIKSQPSWPPLSSTKLADGKRTASDINIDTRKAVLQLENVEILDENYIKKYFGSGGSVTNSIVAPVGSNNYRYYFSHYIDNNKWKIYLMITVIFVFTIRHLLIQV